MIKMLQKKIELDDAFLWILIGLLVFSVISYLVGVFVELPFKLGFIWFIVLVFFSLVIAAKLIFNDFMLEKPRMLVLIIVLGILCFLIYLVFPYADLGEIFSIIHP